MLETEADLAELQRVLDASFDRSGDHLRSAFSQDDRLSATALAAALDGIFEMHLAVVAGDGSPLVAPIDGIFYRGRVWVGIPPSAVRARLVRRDPRVSASYHASHAAFILHGRFRELPPHVPDALGFSALARSLYVEQYRDWFEAWLDERDRTDGPGVVGYLEPRRLFAKGSPAPEGAA